MASRPDVNIIADAAVVINCAACIDNAPFANVSVRIDNASCHDRGAGPDFGRIADDASVVNG